MTYLVCNNILLGGFSAPVPWLSQTSDPIYLHTIVYIMSVADNEDSFCRNDEFVANCTVLNLMFKTKKS